MKLYTNPSLTLAQTLTLSIGERSFGHFTFAYMNSLYNLGRDQKSVSELDFRRKFIIAWNWRLKNKYDGNRACRK